MARGDMAVNTLSVGSEVEILNRKEFEAVSMTVDFTNVNADTNGDYVVKAGTPVNASGVPVSETPWTGAIGLILHDVYKDSPSVAVLKVGYVHTTRAQANSSLTYDAALITALNAAGCRIAFEEPIIATGSGSTTT
jgi:hypothetical protein